MEQSSYWSRSGRWIIGSLALLLCADGRLDARVIDDFSTGPLVIVGADATVEQTQTGLDPNHVVGGSRYIRFRSFAVPASTLTIDDQVGTLSVSPGNCCTYLTVRYGSTADPLQLDLTADGGDRFLFNFAGISDQIPFSLPGVIARDDQNRVATILGRSSLAVQPTGRFSIAVPFTQLPNFNFKNVQSIDLSVSRYGGGTGGAGKTFSLDSILIVPEPIYLASTSIALAAWGLLVRRRGH